jgi:translation initiation factor IF-2
MKFHHQRKQASTCIILVLKEVFKSQKLGDIAGCMVEEGVVRKDSPIREHR